jgi:hypothetical protein
VQYYDAIAQARLELDWAAPGLPLEVIPRSQLYAAPLPVDPPAGGGGQTPAAGGQTPAPGGQTPGGGEIPEGGGTTPAPGEPGSGRNGNGAPVIDDGPLESSGGGCSSVSGVLPLLSILVLAVRRRRA